MLACAGRGTPMVGVTVGAAEAAGAVAVPMPVFCGSGNPPTGPPKDCACTDPAAGVAICGTARVTPSAPVKVLTSPGLRTGAGTPPAGAVAPADVAELAGFRAGVTFADGGRTLKLPGLLASNRVIDGGLTTGAACAVGIGTEGAAGLAGAPKNPRAASPSAPATIWPGRFTASITPPAVALMTAPAPRSAWPVWYAVLSSGFFLRGSLGRDRKSVV